MAGHKTEARFHLKSRAAGYALLAALLSVVLYWLNPPILERLDQGSRDFVFAARRSPPPPPEVVVVSVDEASVKRYGRWPWSRSLQALLLAELKALGAQTIALDIIYLRPQDPQADGDLAQALELPGAAVIGGYFFRDQETLAADPRQLAVLRRHRLQNVFVRAGGRLPLADYPFAETNQPDLAQRFDGLGFFNGSHDPDGLIRSARLVAAYDDDIYPALPLAALAAYLGVQPELRADGNGVSEIRLGERSIPVDEFGRLALNFYSPDRAIPLLSAADVLDQKLPAAAVADKLVLVGVTEVGIADVRPTPLADSFPGVAIHATAAANILQGWYLYQAERSVILADLVLIGLVPLLMVWGLTRRRRLWSMLLLLAGAAAAVFATFFWLVAVHGLLVSLVYPALAVATGFTVFLAYYVLNSQRKTRFLHRAFSSYVAPALVERLLNNPEQLSVAGERKEITVLFADLRGFTALAERLAPEALAQLLNRYLGVMTDIIMAEQGTLDKYIGDAVMAIFNAPLTIDRHPQRAARTALRMLVELEKLNSGFETEHGVRLGLGIGLCTDEAIVGNLGSNRRFDYTAIGDGVNTAARLETATKQYGVDILLSAATRERLGEDFVCRRVDRVRVVGKKRATEIYQLLGERGKDVGERYTHLIDEFEAALEVYFRGEFDAARRRFQVLADAYPEDGPSRVFLRRSKRYLLSPPAAGWVGVHVATEK